MLQILQAPNPILTAQSAPVKKFDESLKSIISQMVESLEAAKDPIGVGLAAPQIGKNLQLFIAKPKAISKIIVFVNPEIINALPIKKGKKIKKHGKKLEGCLSLKDIWGEVQRNPEITLSYFDENGKKYEKTFKGFMATIVAHEMDHLQGILFTQRVLEQKGTLYHSEKDEEGHDVFEKIKI